MGGLRRARLRAFAAIALVTLLAVGVLTAQPTGRLAAQGAPASAPQVAYAVRFAVSSAVSDLPEQAAAVAGADETVPLRELPRKPAAGVSTGDAAIQSFAPPLIPVPGTSFDGLSNQDNLNVFGLRVHPPDTNGDVGPNHYVQAVNVVVRVFSKSGVPLTAPVRMSSLFASLSSSICSTNNNGDPIVLYDPLADRWLLSQFAFTSPTTPPYHQCIAISTTGDPTGSYFLYDFILPGSNLNDYPKFGVWSDAYYMTDNQFLNGGPFNGAGVFAFDRAKMLVGDPSASLIYFDLGTDFRGVLPADLDGSTAPPLGAPNYFAMLEADELGDPADAIRLFSFHADFVNPAASTFTELPESPLAVAAFDPLSPSGRNDIEQPAPASSIHYLDAIADRLMHRLAYRNFGGARESLVVAHTVNVGFDPTTAAGHQAAIRYYEFRRSLPSGTFTVPEQATFAPDTDNRWMGSAAMDGQGNIAVGYSVSSLTTFPSIRYAGRLASDPPNGLSQGEGVLAIGSGVQLSTTGRWGDYSALSVDPADDCTFWYTTEYYTAASQASSPIGWLTRIGNFKLPNCGLQSPQGTVTGMVTDVVTGTPVAGALVSFSPGGAAVVTNASGVYAGTVPTGTYALTVSVKNHPLQSAFGVVVTNGGTRTLNFALSLPPNAGMLTGHVRNATTNAPIASALVFVGSVSSTTDATGLYSLNLTAGTHAVTVLAANYLSASASVVISNQGLTTRDFALSLPTNTGSLTGRVRHATTNAPVAGVSVSAGTASTTTNALGIYSLFLPAATYTVTASISDFLDASAAGVVVSNQLTTTRDLTIQPVVFAQAAYDPALKAPQCGQAGASCDSGALVVGRDTLAGGAEPNQPNTILNSCADGNAGTFHVHESLERIKVYTLDGGAFASGKTVRIQTTVWAFDQSDRLDLYYTADASNPTWTFLTTLLPPGPGAQTLSATYVLPSGLLQAVRGNYRFAGSAGSCTTGTFDDRDDLIFAQSTVTGQVTDALTGAPIAGALVSVSPGGATALTDATGMYAASVQTGTYTLTASHPTHFSQSVSGVAITSPGTTTVNFALPLPANTGILTGHVRSATTSAAIANAGVAVSGGGASTTTDAAGLYALYLPSGTYTVTATASGYVSASVAGVVVSDQVITTSDFALQPVVVVQAAYDATLKVPRCGVAGGGCDSGALLVGRDTISGGAEPNQPNTILNSCPDGTLGFFHSDESVDRIKILTLDGGVFAPGKTVRIDTTVWVFSATVDRLELYYAANANSPSWTFLTTITPSAAGAQTLSTTYVLPAGGLQAVRARYRDSNFTPSLTTCAGTVANYDDYDDLVFTVDTAGSSPLLNVQNVSMTLGGSADGTAAAIGPATSQTPQTSSMTGALAGGAFTAGSSPLAEKATAATVPASANTLMAGVSGVVVSTPVPIPRDLLLQPAAAAAASKEALEVLPVVPPASIAASSIRSVAAGQIAVDVDRSGTRAQEASAGAVTRQPKWEVEFHVGGMLASHPTGGTATLPGPGLPFTTANGNPSRLVSSWYLGDGALLLNQVNAALGVPQRITPLDGILTSSIAQRQRGLTLGGRLSRILGPRYTVEVTVDYGPGLGLSSAGQDGIEASRAAFVSAWNGLFSTGPFQILTLTSKASTIDAGHQLLATGAVNVALRQEGKFVPYVTLGGGLSSIVGGTPTTTLVGEYRSTFNGTTQIAEIDSVTVRHAAGKSMVGVFGGGSRYFVSPRWGVRVDARVYLSSNKVDNVLDVSNAIPGGGSGSVASATSPAVQFSSSPQTGIQSSLSGPAVNGFRTFAGAGLQSQVSITIGIFRRF